MNIVSKILDIFLFILRLSILLLFTYAICNNARRIKVLEEREYKTDTVYIIQEKEPSFLSSNDPSIHLMDALDYYEIQHKDIVYAQALLETGYFKSDVLKKYNNLFGLYNSKTKDYYMFNHWSESVRAYLRYIQYRYTYPNNYYHFLDSIGYAEDPKYVNKVKWLVQHKRYESFNTR